MPTAAATPDQHSAAFSDPSAAAPSRMRLDAVDLLRGLVMVIMLLDHTRDFVHSDAQLYDPTNLDRTTTALFLTRWITHYCAPVFVFLAGTGAYLQLARGKTRAELSRFLLTRGLWLVVLELTIVRCSIAFAVDYPRFPAFLQVIWAIGVSMIVLSALIHLPLRAVAAVGVGIIALHNLTDGVTVQGWQGPGSEAPDALGALWMVLHQPGFIVVAGLPVLVSYPVLAWIGVMAAGYAFGAVYDWQPERRRRFLVRLGLGIIAAFVVIRATNLYGDPSEWAVREEGGVFTVLSFLNVTKYPPSLLFILMTLGPAILSLAWFERLGRGPVARALVTYGRVPLFFYVLQWIVAHSFAIVFSLIAGKSVAYLFAFPGTQPLPPGAGFSLGMTYLAWILGIILTYPLCRWFAGVKRRRTDWWLSYM